ncbi:MAG: hypothetical protein ABH881_02885 [bacterium]
MTPFKLHIIFGLLLILIGIVFDFLFVQGTVGQELVRANPPVLISWAKELYFLSAFYMFVLGFLNIVLALLIRYLAPSINLDWIIFGLIFAGSILVIAAGLWYANAGPSLKWETRCTVLTIGLVFVVLSIGLEIYRFFSLKNF